MPLLKDEAVYTFPLSFAQQRLWFLDQISPRNPFYNIALAIPLKTVIAIELLEKTINQVIRRHEILRTNFISVEGEPLQIVQPERKIDIQLTEFRNLTDEERNLQITQYYTRALSYTFDLSEDLLIRASLLKFGNEDHFFILVMHHIISDGWSLRIFWNEMIAIYNALAANQQPTLKEIIIQYGDFSIWQREWLKDDILKEQLDFWKKQLEDIQTLDLRTDRPRPAVLTYKGAFQPFTVPLALSSALRNICQQQGVTLFMTLLSAYSILLHRYTGQNSIVIGTPVAGRNRVELEELIGFFINTIVIRIDVYSNLTFIDLLQQTKEITLQAFAHQDLPFEKLVEEMHIERDLSKNPLFQVTLQLLNSSNHKTKTKSNLSEADLKLERGAAIFDIALNLVDASGVIDGHFEYSTDLFNEDTMSRFAANFKALLLEIASNPNSKIKDYASLTKPEAQKVVYAFNETETVHPEFYGVHHAIEKNALRFPEAVAVFADEKSYTYSELNNKANQLAHFLIRNGIRKESLVGVCMNRSVDMIAVWLGILKAGGVYVSLDPLNPVEHQKRIITQTGLNLLVAEQQNADELQSPGLTLFIQGELFNTIRNEKKTNPGIPVFPENLAYVIFTSGSLGMPKGVAIPHQGLTNLCNWHINEYAVTAADKASQLANCAFDACTWEIWPYLVAGASIYVVDEKVRIFPELLIKKLIAHAIDFSFLPTPLLHALLDEPAVYKLEAKAIFTGGDWLKKYPPESIRFRLYNHYGPTENTVVTTGTRVEKTNENPSFPSIGKPIANVKTYILNTDLQPVPIGSIGELYIGGYGLARGYYNEPGLTAESFIPDPFSEAGGERLYKTGDKVCFLPDGNIEFFGRKDNQVKVRGFRIELQEIESKLLEFHNVTDAIVMVNPAGTHLQAFIQAKNNIAIDQGRLTAFLSSQLPVYMIPADVLQLDQLPLTANGKIDKKVLSDLQIASSRKQTLIAPTNSLERVLEAIWAEILNKEEIGIDQNFFTQLGGHSLLATQLISRLRNTFQIEIPLTSIFEAPTIARFSMFISKDPIEKERLEKAARLLLEMNQLSDEELELFYNKTVLKN